MAAQFFKRGVSAVFDFWIAPVSAIRLRSFEIAFTASFLLYFFVARFRYWSEWLTPEGYHYAKGGTPSYLIQPFSLLEPWAAVLLGITTAFAGVLVLLGRSRRPALLILFAVSVYIQNADALSAFALNIHYIVGFLLLAVSPMKVSRDLMPGEAWIDSAWSLRTLQMTLLIQFFTAGWCKLLSQDWVHHSDVLWSHVQGPYRNQIAAWMLQFLPMPVWTAMQWAAFGFELIGPFLLIWRPTRWIGLLWAGGFVVFIALTMNDLLYFTLQLSCYLLLFLSVKELSWLWRRIPLRRRKLVGQ